MPGPYVFATVPDERDAFRASVEQRRRARAWRREPPPQVAPISNARIAIVIVLVAEIMFFAGLVGAYLLFRFGSAVWPPANLPRLPLAVTWVNTLVLIASGFTMLAALRAVRSDDGTALRRQLLLTAVLGLVFLSVQGSEWARLIRHGLTLGAGTYGSTFYVLIGSHAAHVAIAVLWVVIVAIGAWQGRFTAVRHAAVEVCAIYWFFVCALWLALFALVYH